MKQNSKPFSSFAKAIQKWISPTTWSNNLHTCCAHGQESSSMPGLRKQEAARSANCKALFWVLNEIRPLWWRGSPFPKTTITLHNAPRHSDQYHFESVKTGWLALGRKRLDPRSL